MSPAPLRKDAQRNRDALVAAARETFAAADDNVPLETIARAAGVGIGTLYRHFPTREALVEAVYGAELDDVVAAAGPLLAAHSADVALRAWMQRYAQFIETKRGMIDTLRAGWAAGRITRPTTRTRVTETLARFVEAGAGEGVLRGDVEADDVTALLLGVFLSTGPLAPDAQVARLLDLLVDSLRPPGAVPPGRAAGESGRALEASGRALGPSGSSGRALGPSGRS